MAIGRLCEVRLGRQGALALWMGIVPVLAAHTAAATTLYGLAAGGTSLVRFESATPARITGPVAITGLQPGEELVGIDFRPRTGQLMGIGIVFGFNDTGRLYRLDPQTGAATLVGAAPFSTTIPTGTVYGVDFNPTVDVLRVVNDADASLRVSPNTGSVVGIDPGINPVSADVTGVAYDRNFDGRLGAAGTTLYGIDVVANQLVTIGGINQAPSPNTGTVQNSLPLGVEPAGDAGFDIDVDGAAFAALRVGGVNGLYTINLATGAATLVDTIGDGTLAVGGLAAVRPSVVVLGADAGLPPTVRMLDVFANAELRDFSAFDPKLRKGVRVATGDVTRDSVPDIIAGIGKGGSRIRVFDGATGAALAAPLGDFVALDPKFKGGVHVAAGDVNGDGFRDVIVGAAKGAPQVKVFSGQDGVELVSFVAFDDPKAKGGVSVAAADLNNDGDAEIVVGAGKGSAPMVRLFQGDGTLFTGAPLNEFLAYDPSFKGGVFVAAGDVDGDGLPDVVTGPAKDGTLGVQAFTVQSGFAAGTGFRPYESKFKGGVRVALGDVDGDGRLEILTVSGRRGVTEVRAFDGRTFARETAFAPFDSPIKKGAFIGAVRR